MLRRPWVARPQAGPSCFYLGGVAAPIRHTEAVRHGITRSDLHCGGVADVADPQEGEGSLTLRGRRLVHESVLRRSGRALSQPP